ncbi:MAG: pyridoxine 5'-phosphate synthase [Gemmatimonas sp. SG8_38_2]|nr:MAG: pyridoxine 5'-phosphate synthase [Gemmatimonas sp. SG8_38_2]
MRLYINVDHVATVRQARRTDEPDPVEAALACERGGADGITIHLREDRRHIQDSDVRAMAGAVTTALNLELAAALDIVTLAIEIQPHHATIVPERRAEVTTEGGLDLGVGRQTEPRLIDTIERLHQAGILVSLFIDPDHATIDRAAELGVAAIELHTGEYANRYRQSEEPLERLRIASRYAKSLELAVHAGHGLTYRNVQPVAAIPEIEELNIGHSIVSRSIMVGIEAGVREMRSLVDTAR